MSTKKKAEMKAVIKSKFLCQDKFSNDIEKVTLRLENFSVEFMAILSRRLDEDS